MKLQVPENITLQWEAWRGFGLSALIPTAIITAVAIVLAIIFCVLNPKESSSMTAVLAVGLTFGFCIGLFSKLENNQSIFDFILRQGRYKREQQVFLYQKETEEICLAEET